MEPAPRHLRLVVARRDAIIGPRVIQRGRTWFAAHPRLWTAGPTPAEAMAAWRRIARA